MTTTGWRREGQHSGMVTPQGILEARVLQSRGVWRPTKVELSADETELQFEVPNDYDRVPIRKWGWREVTDPRRVATEFTIIRTAGQAKHFAEQYGPIFVCHEHLDMSVPALCRWTGDINSGLRNCRWKPKESVDVWLRCVRQANGALRLISKLQRNEPLHKEAEAWRDLMFIPPGAEDSDATLRWLTSRNARGVARPFLIQWLNGFPMDTWPFRLALNEEYELRIDMGLGFLPIIWFIIAEAAAGGRTVQVCSGCGKPYMRLAGKRAPKTNQRNYCSKCGKQGDYSFAKKQSRRVRIDKLRELTDLILGSCNAGPLRIQNLDDLRDRWNNQHPAAAFVDRTDLEDELRLLVKGSYQVVTGRKKAEVITKLREFGFEVEITTSQKESI